MAEQRIGAGATHVFPAGQLADRLDLQNRHGVNGVVTYQIAGRFPVPITFNNDNHVINNIDGQVLTVTNNLPNSLYCVY